MSSENCSAGFLLVVPVPGSGSLLYVPVMISAKAAELELFLGHFSLL